MSKTTEEQIFEQIEIYRKTGNSSSDIDTMMNCRKNISILCAYYTSELNACIHSYKSNSAKRKQLVLEQRLLNPKSPTWKIEANVQPSIESIADYEIAVETKKMLLNSFYEITSEINQRVAKLRAENGERRVFGA